MIIIEKLLIMYLDIFGCSNSRIAALILLFKPCLSPVYLSNYSCS